MKVTIEKMVNNHVNIPKADFIKYLSEQKTPIHITMNDADIIRNYLIDKHGLNIKYVTGYYAITKQNRYVSLPLWVSKFIKEAYRADFNKIGSIPKQTAIFIMAKV